MWRHNIAVKLALRPFLTIFLLLVLAGLAGRLEPVTALAQNDVSDFPLTRQYQISSDATLSSLTLSGTTFWHPSFSTSATAYVVQVGIDMSETTVTATANHRAASVDIERRTSFGSWTDTDGTVPLDRGQNRVRVEVTAQDTATPKTYYILITRTSTPFPTLGELSTDDPPVNFRVTGFDHDSAGVQWEVPRGRHISQYELTLYENSGSGFVDIGRTNRGDSIGGGSVAWSSLRLKADTQYRYNLKLMNDALIPIIEDSVTLRTLSSDGTLSALALSGVDIGTFSPNDTYYEAAVADDVNETTVRATVNHSGAGYTVNLGGVVDSDGLVSLSMGVNVITVVVTAQDGVTTQIYAVKITRGEQETIAPEPILGDLASDDPPVNFRITGYDEDEVSFSWEIPHNRGIAGYTLARHDHDGTEFILSDWSASGDVIGGDSAGESNAGLAADSQYRFDLELKDANGTTVIEKSLEVRTPATGATTLSSDATLSTLSLSGVSLDPEFTSSTYRYSGRVASDYTQTTVVVSAKDSSASSTIRLGGTEDPDGVLDLTPGRNIITVHVTAADGVTTRIYTVVLRREKNADVLSDDASLRALFLKDVDFGTFDADTTTYAAEVGNDVSETTVTPVRSDAEASHVINLNGTQDLDGAISLAVGQNVITIVVTAEDGANTETYTLNVTRAATLSSDATLRALTLSDIDFGIFDPSTADYSVDVASDVSHTTIAVTPSHPRASYTIEVGGVEAADGVVNLEVGDNVITVEVTAEDGETTRTYTVTVSRPEAPSLEPADTCVQSVASDGTIEGSWDDTCLSENEAPGGAGDRYARFYTFTLTEEKEVTISLSSSQDTYLYVLEGHGDDGQTLHSHDDITAGGVNTNSRLSLTLQPGDYTIEATTYQPATAGDFALTIQGLGEVEEPEPEPAPDPEVDACVEAVDADGTIEGTWDDTCVSDRAALSGTGDRYARFYTFTLDEAAEVTITLESDKDTYLYLLAGHGKDGETLYENDDIAPLGQNLDSRISEELPAGDYTIEATTYRAQAEGEFTLTVAGLNSVE